MSGEDEVFSELLRSGFSPSAIAFGDGVLLGFSERLRAGRRGCGGSTRSVGRGDRRGGISNGLSEDGILAAFELLFNGFVLGVTTFLGGRGDATATGFFGGSNVVLASTTSDFRGTAFCESPFARFSGCEVARPISK